MTFFVILNFLLELKTGKKILLPFSHLLFKAKFKVIIKFIFKIFSSKTSFVQYTKTCMQVLRQEEMRNCKTKWCRLKTSFNSHWDQMKISFYQIFLWLWWSGLGRMSRKMLGYDSYISTSNIKSTTNCPVSKYEY